MPEQKLYSIGRFAEMSDVSIKQLRYLEEKGLLIPKVRNTDNNYRYYSRSQMDRLVFIKTLRDLGVPFDDVVCILQTKDLNTCVDIIKHRLESISGDIKKLLFSYEQSTAYLTQLLQGKNSIAELKNDIGCAAPYKIVEVPPQDILFTRYRVNVAAHNLFLERYFELKKLGTAQNTVFSESMSAIFHDGYTKQFENQSGDLETFFPVGPGVGHGGHVRRFGGFKGLSCMYVGHYRHMEAHYRSMAQWGRDNGLALMDISIETYTLGPDITLLPEHYVTQMVIPLQGSVV